MRLWSRFKKILGSADRFVVWLGPPGRLVGVRQQFSPTLVAQKQFESPRDGFDPDGGLFQKGSAPNMSKEDAMAKAERLANEANDKKESAAGLLDGAKDSVESVTAGAGARLAAEAFGKGGLAKVGAGATIGASTIGAASANDSRKPVWIDKNSHGKKAWPKWKTFGLWLLPFIALVGGATLWAIDHIEDDLEDATIRELLDEYGIQVSNDDVDFDFRDGDVALTLPAGVTSSEIENHLKRTINSRDNTGALEGDIRSISIAGTPAPAPEPVASGELDIDVLADGESITLSGDVLNQTQYDELQAAATAAVGADNVTNNLHILDAAPARLGADGRVTALAASIAAMTGDNIVSGDAHLDDTSMTVNAVATSPEAKAALDGRVARAGGRVGLGGEVTVPEAESGPIDVLVSTDGSSITLDGTVLSEAQRDILVEAANDAVGAANVTGNLVVSGLAEQSPNADAKIDDMAALFAGFSGLTQGSGSVSDSALDFSGTAADATAQASIEGLVGDANDSTSVTIAVAEATVEQEVDLLQAELDELQAEILENVVFPSDSAELSDVAKGTLDKVADAMTLYQRPVVLVGGHTDADGNDDYNLDLSDRRAKAVRQYLVDQGIELDRLVGTGFGETEPVAPNDTAENKQQNRRVAFTALAAFAQ